MKLAGHEIVPPDQRGEWRRVVRLGGHVFPISGDRMIGVDEIDRRLRLQPFEDRRVPQNPERVPSHVGHFQPWQRREFNNAAGENAKPLVFTVLLADVEEELQAQADAQAGLAGLDGLSKSVAQAGAAQFGRGVGEGPHSRQDHLGGAMNLLGVRGDLGGGAHRLDRLLDAPEIPHSVVDDRDHGLGVYLLPLRAIRIVTEC